MKRLIIRAGFLSVFAGTALFVHGQEAQPLKEVTFSKDIAPIFQRVCQNCHRPGSIAPMSLLSYKDARPWARSIKEKVATGVMPPWHADPHYGSFANDR